MIIIIVVVIKTVRMLKVKDTSAQTYAVDKNIIFKLL